MCSQRKFNCILTAGFLSYFLAALLVILQLDKMVWIQYWAWLEQEVGPETSRSVFQPNLLWYAELCPQIHEAEGNLASAALPGNTGQSNVPSDLSTVLVSVLPSLIWVAKLRERSYSKCDLPCQPAVNPSQVPASSKGKEGAFTRHFPAVPQELCQGRAECSTSAHRTPTSVQKSSLELLEGHNPTCVWIFNSHC